MESQNILPLFEELQALASGSKLIEGTPPFRIFVRTARGIFDQAAELLEFDDWERMKFDPRFPWPGLPRRRSVQRRQTLFLQHGHRLHHERVSIADVRIALDFAKKQVGQMFRELALCLMAGEVDINPYCAWTVLELQASFRSIWKPTRRRLLNADP